MESLDLTADGPDGTVTAVVAVGHGARIASLRVPRPGGDAVDVVGRGSDSPHGWGAFPMAPWAGRVRDGALTWRGRTHRLPTPKPPHALHGTVARVPWEVVEHGDASAALRRDLGDDWPWPGHAVVRYELAPDRLTTHLEVHCDGPDGSEMPAWTGIHPWFPRHLPGPDGADVPVTVGLHARAMLARDDAGIATEREVRVPVGAANAVPVDDCFVDVDWPLTLTWPGVLRLEVRGDCRYAVVMTEREGAVAAEPQTAPPDAAALGEEHVVRPGRPHRLTTTWTWRPA
ncbi:aldose epimerase family protein [Thalassiella azotivora]